MKNKLLIGIVFFFIFNIFTELSAQGIGIFVPSASVAGSGTLYFEDEDEGYDIDYNHLGLGLFFDSNMDGLQVYNFRIGLIYEKVSRYLDYASFNYRRFATDMYFGFGLIKNKYFRLWLGPSLRFAYMLSKPENPYDEWRIGFGFGPAIGSNVHIGSILTLCFDLGLRSNFYFGEESWEYHSATYYKSYYLTHYEIFINAGFAFRLSR